jgi:hypothetical protein
MFHLLRLVMLRLKSRLWMTFSPDFLVKKSESLLAKSAGKIMRRLKYSLTRSIFYTFNGHFSGYQFPYRPSEYIVGALEEILLR